VKKAEDSNDVIVRLHEAHGNKTRARLQFANPPKHIEEADLLERRTAQLVTRNAQLDIQFNPFEIKTLKLKL
jgi:alpha-mannosidase